MKRLFSVLLVLVLMAVCLPVAVAEDVPTLTLWVPDNPNVIDWEDNAQTRYIEQTLGCNLDFVKLPSNTSEYQQKLDMAVLAGGADLPDVVITNFSLSLVQLQLYAEAGLAVDITNYVKGSMPLLEANLADLTANPLTKEEYIAYLTSPDGNVYAMGQASVSVNNSVSEGRSVVFGEWRDAYLQAAGLEELDTIEQFKDMLIYFRDHDMNGNGDPSDEIPMLSYKDYFMKCLYRQLMNPFVYSQEHYFYNDNGTIRLSVTMDGFKEGVKFIRSLFEEGLISTLSLTQDKTQFQAICTGEPTTVGVLGNYSSSIFPSSDPRRAGYYPLGALEGPTGLRQCAQTPNIPGARYFVTTKCQNVELAMKLADMLAGREMSTWNRYGIENENWIRLTGDKIGESEYSSLGYPGDIKMINDIWGNPQSTNWGETGCTVKDGSEFGLRLIAERKEGSYSHTAAIGANIIKEVGYANKNNAVFGLVFTAEEQEIIAEYQTAIESYIEESFAQFVTGMADIDTEFDGFVNELKAMGMDEYLSAVQSCWNRRN